jgi:very-short-patch-repair endonuclease
MASSTSSSEAHADGQVFSELMRSSRKNLLDLSLRNKLLNFAPVGPDHKDDGRAHKYLKLGGQIETVWERLVATEKQLRIFRFNPAELGDASKRLHESLRKTASRIEADSVRERIKEVSDEIAEGEAMANEGHVWVDKLGEEAYQKRLRRLRDEAKTLEDTTGDSAFFLAFGFLKWPERPKTTNLSVDPSADGVSTARFAPLILIKVSLTDEGKGTPGRRKFRIVPEDDPQDNQSLKAKLKEEWDFTLPDFGENKEPADYFKKIKRAITLSKLNGFEVLDNLALGFFNFARYRLWLDLDPKQWKGVSPEEHPIVKSILGVSPLDTSCPRVIDATRDGGIADEVARHQETEDIPIVRDADTSQYSALLYAQKGKSLVVIGPPGSGKSQTITNLVATSIANGKRVLFVAQKLPALDVVARRIREAGLGDFCLQFYSAKQDGEPERKPVTPVQIHAQLTSARNLLSERPRFPAPERRAPVLAKKLNEYASSVHAVHPIFSETLQYILCTALKLKEDAIAAWGVPWNDTLLTVRLPDATAPSSEWIETRVRLVSEIARLRHEAGGFWEGWNPDSLTVLDIPCVEGRLEEHRNSIKNLCDWCVAINSRVADWHHAHLNRLAESSSSIAVPQKCSDEFVRAISRSPELMRLAHELERELAGAESAHKAAAPLLEILPDGTAATASFAQIHLAEVDHYVEPTATYSDAKTSLEQLSVLLRTTDLLCQTLPVHPDGIAAFAGQNATLTAALVVSIAQLEDGKFRRAPAQLLPALARLLVSQPEIGDDAMRIAERVDELLTKKAASARAFGQPMRAEKFVSDYFIEQLGRCYEAGIGPIPLANTTIAGTACEAARDDARQLLKGDGSILTIVADGRGQLSNEQVKRLATASELIRLDEMTPPALSDARLVRAWAEGSISEAEARAAATAHEKANELETRLRGLLGATPPTHTTAAILATSIDAAESLGLHGATLEEIAALSSKLVLLEKGISAVQSGLVAVTRAYSISDFASVASAIKISSSLEPIPNLRSTTQGKLVDANLVRAAGSAILRAQELRKTATPGAYKILAAAARRIRECVQAANVAEEVSASITGIRRPTTLRELRCIGAATPVLRAMPPLPLGCDAVEMSGEQYAATILHLIGAANKLQGRILALPQGVDYKAMPSSAEALKELETLKKRQTSTFRFLSSDWRSARATLRRVASALPMPEAIAAFESACAIKVDEENFARVPSGEAALGSYFIGTKTDWEPFSAFAEWTVKLTNSLDGFERNERVVSAWRAENGNLNAVANACAQFEAAASECRAAFPDLFGTTSSPFQSDVPVAVTKERAASILNKIDSLLASPQLALTSIRDSSSAASLTEVIERTSEAEREIVSLATSPKQILGNSFTGRPEEWTALQEIVDWANKLHALDELDAARGELFDACVGKPDVVQGFIADSLLTQTVLEAIRETLARSRIRPDDQTFVTEFFAHARSCLEKISAGRAALSGAPDDSIESMRSASALISELHFELGRSERLRNAVAPSVPTSVSVEETLNWALSLESRNLPKRLVAALAEFPNETALVHGLLTLSANYAKKIGALRAVGLEGAAWLDACASVEDVAENTNIVAEGLATARRGAIECGAKVGCTLGELYEGFMAVRQYLQLKASVPSWVKLLGCDPFAADNPSEAIRETIFWVESLHADRVPVGVMYWLVVEKADQRMHWWTSLVKNSKTWRAQRTAVRQSSLPEFDKFTPLENWRTALSDRHAALALAIDQLGHIVKQPETSLSKLRDASDSLRVAAESIVRADGIQKKMPGAEQIHSSSDVKVHRAFSKWITSQKPEIAAWALNASADVAFSHLAQLKSLLKEESKSRNSLKQTIERFGESDDDGPGGIFSDEQSFARASERIQSAIQNLHGLAAWAALQREIKRALKLGVDRIASEVLAKKVSPEAAVAALKAGIAWQKALIVWKENPPLEKFRSARHEEIREEFAEVDIAAVRSQNRQRIISALHKESGGGVASWGNGYVDQLLLHESTKRKRLMPVRKLVEATGRRMQELCPCWLATPAAIAQFIAPGSADFDLIIMDEASQLTPEDSWGAIARGRQVVIVGDPKQMPPSSFFEQASSEEDEYLEFENELPIEKPQVPVLKGHQQESVLKAAESCLPQVWLNWHYRSLHEGLIAPANALSYDRRLVLFPSSHISHAHLGVRHTYVQDGLATTGQVKNANEAAAVVNKLVEIAGEFAQPAHRKQAKVPHSVGIIAMNIHQQETIKDLIDHRRAQEPSFDRNLAILEAHETEPFFVRNLENVQGDERDVIIVSTTYGPNTLGGTPTQRFFPINQDGGERRFNVLITRAKWRMEVFTSLRSTQMTSPQVGVQHMRAFLEYCETGRLTTAGVQTDRWFDSPFEAHVHAVLESRGYPVTKQVGVAGYYIDLAIKDPVAPGRYVLGIECDGATYHSSRAARDRDRLREQVLAERGWKLHRIWSTEWFYNNAAVRKSLFEAVEAAIAKA